MEIGRYVGTAVVVGVNFSVVDMAVVTEAVVESRIYQYVL